MKFSRGSSSTTPATRRSSITCYPACTARKSPRPSSCSTIYTATNVIILLFFSSRLVSNLFQPLLFSSRISSNHFSRLLISITPFSYNRFSSVTASRIASSLLATTKSSAAVKCDAFGPVDTSHNISSNSDSSEQEVKAHLTRTLALLDSVAHFYEAKRRG